MAMRVPTVITSAASGTGATVRAAARRDRAQHPRTVEGRGVDVGAAMAARGKRMGVVTRAALNLSEDSSFDEEMAVPKDQRPVNELKALQQAPLYSWVISPDPVLRHLCSRLSPGSSGLHTVSLLSWRTVSKALVALRPSFPRPSRL
jgi:hypothetical protein